MDSHLRIAIGTLIELVIRSLRFLYSNLKRDDETRLCLASND
jgi:hypothetical protein